VLLDLDPTGMGVEEQTPMSPEAAVDVLLRMAEELGVDVGDWTGVLCSDVGGSDQRIIHSTLDRIASVSGGRMHCLVIPGRLDDLESEALSRWRV
jgi:diphthamide biosynthesis methyltransferase